MKKNIVIVLLIGLFLLMAGCGGGATPKGAVDGFMAAAQAGDMAKVKSLSTGAMLEFWGLLDEMKKMDFPGVADMDITAELKDVKTITTVEKEVTGDTAKVDVTVDEDSTTYIVTKTDGNWLISDIEMDGQLLSEGIAELKDAIEQWKNMPEMLEGIPDFTDMPADMPEMPEPEGNE